MDVFIIEIGGEVYVFLVESFMVMVGVSNGLIKGDVIMKICKFFIYGKVVFDKQFNENICFCFFVSIYMNVEFGCNIFYGGDCAGFCFYEVMEVVMGQSDFLGCLNLGFSINVISWQISFFVKVVGFELFVIYE